MSKKVRETKFNIMQATIEWIDDHQYLKMIDQTLLPEKLSYLHLKTLEAVADSIKNMNVRGAPAIGVTAAFGMVLAAIEYKADPKKKFLNKMTGAAELLANTRPTAINLFWAIDEMKKVINFSIEESNDIIVQKLKTHAQKLWQEDYLTNREMGKHGAKILEDGDTVLTHCNAGSLATVKYGTALAPIRWAIQEQNKKISVIADETRPRLQGARLTAYELHRDNIPVQVETDNMAGLMMRMGKIQKVIVGADRIVRDVVFNKIGTYMVAIAAHHHHIPFYVVAPKSTLSMNETENDVKIEERDGDFEVARLMGRSSQRIVPEGVPCLNYAFDATPMSLVTGIITEDGIFTPTELVEKYG